ncbi:MAG TPA: hypothetical protein VJ371_02555 [Streptosporangiaceae bacterium]|nr:hypothetical protein [Streptosporangiaceae bacterium]
MPVAVPGAQRGHRPDPPGHNRQNATNRAAPVGQERGDYLTDALGLG